jgi:mevalonate kinase
MEVVAELVMNKVRFRTRTYGKWILAGEHAVLRGSPALAFPLTTRSLQLDYFPQNQGLDVEFAGPNGAELKLLFYGVIENALSRLRVGEPLHGRFVLDSSLPVGAGLGASAALCGAVARWCEASGWIPTNDVYEFARELENLFHGESSGVDLAVSLSAQGIRFVRGGERKPVKINWWPKLYLSYSGQRGMTAECVAKVKRLFETDPALAAAMDAQMRRSVQLCEQALAGSESESLPLLKQAIDLGRECFEKWELCGGDVGSHMRLLSEAGAYAVKPTGSGGGGYVLSLWRGEPPAALAQQLIALTSAPQPPR